MNLTIRDWEAADAGKLLELHIRMNPGYQLPAEFGPLFCIRKAVLNEKGCMVAMAAVKLTAEGFFWTDSEVSKLERMRALMLLNEKCGEEAKKLGLEDCSAWLPPRMQRCFGRILRRLGWQRSPWRPWSKIL